MDRVVKNRPVPTRPAHVNKELKKKVTLTFPSPLFNSVPLFVSAPLQRLHPFHRRLHLFHRRLHLFQQLSLFHRSLSSTAAASLPTTTFLRLSLHQRCLFFHGSCLIHGSASSTVVLLLAFCHCCLYLDCISHSSLSSLISSS